jgi:hypothetical protein
MVSGCRCVGGQIHAGVANRDEDMPILQLRLDRKDPACVLHRLDRVEHEMDQNLLQLHGRP